MSGRYSNKKKRKMRREASKDIIKRHMELFADFIRNDYDHEKFPEYNYTPLTFPNNHKSRWANR